MKPNEGEIQLAGDAITPFSRKKHHRERRGRRRGSWGRHAPVSPRRRPCVRPGWRSHASGTSALARPEVAAQGAPGGLGERYEEPKMRSLPSNIPSPVGSRPVRETAEPPLFSAPFPAHILPTFCPHFQGKPGGTEGSQREGDRLKTLENKRKPAISSGF